MNIKNNIYGIFAMGMVMATMSLTSCAGDEELSQGLDASKDKIVSPADVSFGGNVTTAEIKIQASGLWSISGKFEWFTLSKTQGSGDDVITITTKDKENISAIDTRTETLVLTTDTRQREIKVEQSPAQEVLEVVPNSIEFGTTKDAYKDATFNPKIVVGSEMIYDITPLYMLNSITNTIECSSSEKAVKAVKALFED